MPRPCDCRRSSTGFTTNAACRRSYRCSALNHTGLLRKLLRHIRDERSLPPKHSLLCAAPHKPIKKTSAQCKVSTQHKQLRRFSFCERGKFAMRCSQNCRAPPQHLWPWFVACLRSISLLCAAPHKAIFKRASPPCNRESSASINETSVRCMDEAWRGVEGSSTKQPRLYDCRRSFHVARAAAKTVARQHAR